MTTKKQKLELTWIGKRNPEYDIANIEPSILEERTDCRPYPDLVGEAILPSVAPHRGQAIPPPPN